MAVDNDMPRDSARFMTDSILSCLCQGLDRPALKGLLHTNRSDRRRRLYIAWTARIRLTERLLVGGLSPAATTCQLDMHRVFGIRTALQELKTELASVPMQPVKHRTMGNVSCGTLLMLAFARRCC